MRYTLPGYLLFSPWPRNLYRFLRNCRNTLQQIGLRDGVTKARENESDFFSRAVPDRIFQATQRAQRLIRAMKDFQGLAMPDSIAALDRWSNEPRRDTNISLRISQGTLVYDDGSERCEIEIPDAFTNYLSVPSALIAYWNCITSEPGDRISRELLPKRLQIMMQDLRLLARRRAGEARKGQDRASRRDGLAQHRELERARRDHARQWPPDARPPTRAGVRRNACARPCHHAAVAGEANPKMEPRRPKMKSSLADRALTSRGKRLAQQISAAGALREDARTDSNTVTPTKCGNSHPAIPRASSHALHFNRSGRPDSAGG